MDQYIVFLAFVLTCHIVSCEGSCDDLTHFRCDDGICISIGRLCNRISDCDRGEDESNCDSFNCPTRNVSIAHSNGYICSEPCDHGGRCGRHLKCVCDDECGMSCISPRIRCSGQPPSVKYGKKYHIIRTKGKTAAIIRTRKNFRFGDMARYQCKSRMKLVGPLPRCQGGARWSSELPRCIGPVCEETPPEVKGAKFLHYLRRHGRVNRKVTRDPEVNDVVAYECEQGLTLVGNAPKCKKSGSWSGHTLKCVGAKESNCPDDGDCAINQSSGEFSGDNDIGSGEADCPDDDEDCVTNLSNVQGSGDHGSGDAECPDDDEDCAINPSRSDHSGNDGGSGENECPDDDEDCVINRSRGDHSGDEGCDSPVDDEDCVNRGGDLGYRNGANSEGSASGEGSASADDNGASFGGSGSGYGPK